MLAATLLSSSALFAPRNRFVLEQTMLGNFKPGQVPSSREAFEANVLRHATPEQRELIESGQCAFHQSLKTEAELAQEANQTAGQTGENSASSTPTASLLAEPSEESSSPTTPSSSHDPSADTTANNETPEGAPQPDPVITTELDSGTGYTDDSPALSLSPGNATQTQTYGSPPPESPYDQNNNAGNSGGCLPSGQNDDSVPAGDTSNDQNSGSNSPTDGISEDQTEGNKPLTENNPSTNLADTTAAAALNSSLGAGEGLESEDLDSEGLWTLFENPLSD